jgi:hypothetical protein
VNARRKRKSLAKQGGAWFVFLLLITGSLLAASSSKDEDPQRRLETVGENADLYRLKLECLKPNGDWLVKQARLERFTGTSFSE